MSEQRPAGADLPMSSAAARESADRVPPDPGDTGEVRTLPDGSISIPLLEERLVIERRRVVRERIIIRKHTTVEQHRIEATLRSEHLDIEADPNVRVVDERAEKPTED